MANLPNLPTTTIGLLAYWNVGVNISQANLTAFAAALYYVEIYDNGVQGKIRVNQTGAIDAAGQLLVGVRMRSDGVIMAYNLRAADVDLTLPTPAIQTLAAGPIDIPRGCMLPFLNMADGGRKAATTTMLAEALAVMETGYITSPGKTPVNKLTAGHFDFQFDPCNKLYLMGDDLFTNANLGTPGFTSTVFDSFNFTQPGAGNAVLAAFVSCRTGLGGNGPTGARCGGSLTLGALVLSAADITATWYKFIGLTPNATNWPLTAPGFANTVNSSCTASHSMGGGNPQVNANTQAFVFIYCVEA